MPARYDLFISYAHADAEPVQRLAGALRNAGLRVWIDETEISDFDSITGRITEGLAQAKALLAYYSAAYPTRRACQWELTAAFLAAQQERDPRRRVLVVNPEERAGHIQPIQLRDEMFVEAPKDEQEATSVARRVATHLKELKGPLQDIQPLQAPTWYGRIGQGSPRFVGRVDKMWELHEALHSTDVAVISGAVGPGPAHVRGAGGIGKSLLAEEYARRFGAAYPGGVFWLRAYGNDDAKGALGPAERDAERGRQLLELAVGYGLRAEGAKPAEASGLLGKAIEERGGQCLWVIDDVPSGMTEEELGQWIVPSAMARTIITTRSRDYASRWHLDLSVLEPQEAYQLLTAHRAPDNGAEEAAAHAIVDELGHHALAVDISGGALRRSRGLKSFADFLAELKDPGKDALELAGELSGQLPGGHEQSIASTLLKSIDLLGPEGKEILLLASLLAVEPIRPKFIAGTLSKAGADQADINNHVLLGLKDIDGLSLGDFAEKKDGALSVHTLISRTVRYRVEAPDNDGLRRAAVSFLAEHLARHAGDIRQHGETTAELPHARELCKELTTSESAELGGWLARVDYESGAYESARELFERVHEVRSRVLGPEHPSTLTSMHNLASTVNAQGDMAKARELQELVLEAKSRVLGPEHPSTLTSMNNLAETLYGQGDLTKARELQELVLEVMSRVLGPEHPSTLTSMNNLAETVYAQGDLAKARGLHERVLEVRSRVLGPEHPDTLTSMNNLAETVYAQGDLAKARGLHERVLEVRSRVLGPEHPDTLTSTGNLALAVKAQGDLAKARDLEERVLEVSSRVLGPEHPDTLTSMNNLALTVKAQGDQAKARELHEREVEVCSRVLGPEHPDTSISAWNLYCTVRDLGDSGAAKAILSDALEWLAERPANQLGRDQQTIREYVLNELARSTRKRTWFSLPRWLRRRRPDSPRTP